MTNEPARYARQRRVALLAVMTASVVLAVLWATLMPPFEQPDEINHFAYAQKMAFDPGLPVQGTLVDPVLEPELQQPPAYYVLAGAAYRLGVAAGLEPTDTRVWMRRIDVAQASPVGLGLGLGAPFADQRGVGVDPGETYPFDLLLIRLLGALGLPATIYFTWRTWNLVMPGRPDAGVAAAAVAGLLPQHLFNSTAASNDALAVPFAAGYLYVLLRLRESSGDFKTFAVVGAVIGLGIFVKSTLYLLFPLALLVRPRDISTARWLRGASLLVGVAACIGGGWFIRNYILYGDPLARQELILPSLYAWNIRPKSITDEYFRWWFWIQLWESFAGRFGMFQVRIDPRGYRLLAVVAGATAVGLALEARMLLSSLRGPTMASLGGPTMKTGGQPHTAAAAGSLPAREAALRLGLLALVIVVTLGGVVVYNLSVSQPQGRYMFPALSAIAVFAALGAAGLFRLASRQARDLSLTAGVLVAVLATALNGYMLLRVIVPFYGPAAFALVPGM